MSNRENSANATKTKRSRAKEEASVASAALMTTLTIVKESLDGVPILGLKAAVGRLLEIIKAVDKAKGSADDIDVLRAHVEHLSVSIIEPLKQVKITEALRMRVDALTRNLESIEEDHEKVSKKSRIHQFFAAPEHATTVSGLDRMVGEAIQTFLTGGVIVIKQRVVNTNLRTEATLEAVIRAGKQTEAIHSTVSRVGETSEIKTSAIKTPEIRTPEIKAPEIKAPEIKASEVKASAVQAPEIRTPEIRTPDIRTPDIRTPDIRTPDIRTPDIKTPEIKGPEISRGTSDAIHQVVRTEDKSETVRQVINEFIPTKAEQDISSSLPYSDARFDPASRTMPPGCLKDTRVALLAEIFNWIYAPKTEERIYWLHGLSGTGKSTIAHTIAERLAQNGHLGASFFFSRDVEDRRDALRVLSSIAHQLAEFHPGFKKNLVQSLAGRKDFETTPLSVQMENLLADPFRSMGSSSSISSLSLPSPIVIIMDALDECEQQPLVTRLLSLMSEFALSLPDIDFKLFITSRPEHHIIASFGDKTANALQPFVFHDIETSSVQADIASFLLHELAIVARDFQLSDASKLWPLPNELEELVQRTGALFIVASTSIKFIADPDVGEPRQQLAELLSDGRTSGVSSYEELDQVYLRVLKASVGRFDDPNHQVCARFRDVVGAIIIARDPLSPTNLQRLLGCDMDYITAALERLRSVIIIPYELRSTSEPLRVFHLSFPIFLTERCSDARFAIDPILHHSKLALHCLNVLNSFLKRDICELPNPLLLNSEIPDLDNRLKNIVLPHHRYACRHWGFHLRHASEETGVVIRHQVLGHQLPGADVLLKAVSTFVETKLLQWIEVLSLLGWLDIAIPMLKAAETWLMRLGASHKLLGLVKDGKRLILQYFEPLKLGASQIYHSGLAFMPHCRLYECYTSELGTSATLVRKRETGWDLCMHILLEHTDAVSSVSFSHDSTLAVSGSGDGNVCIWDAITGSLVITLEENISTVYSVAFSHDSTLIASGSSNKNVYVWDAITGSLVRTLEGHTSAVYSVAFSHDSSLIVSGSGDKHVHIWNTVTGSLVKTLEGHTSTIYSVAFSHDSTLIASSSDDTTVHIWDATTGFLVRTLEGHTDTVYSAAFSHDGTLVVSSSGDNNICIWDAISGSLVKTLKGHRDAVISVVFSHDSTLIVSGSSDNNVCIWDAITGSLVRTLKGHTEAVISAAFSHDSTLVVSGSGDMSVRIWDAITESLVKTPEGHTDIVYSVAFSYDSTLMVSGSGDKSLCIWNATTGSLVTTLRGHASAVISVAFSDDNTLIVSGSTDMRVCIWDAVTGFLIKKLEGHTDAVYSVAFSSDKTLIVSGSGDNEVCLWDAITGSLVKTLVGHTDAVYSVAFSHDGNLIVSGSSDRNVCIWDAINGSLLKTLEGHTSSVKSVAFSRDDTYIATYTRQEECICWRTKSYIRIPTPTSALQQTVAGFPQQFTIQDQWVLDKRNPEDPRKLCHLPIPSNDIVEFMSYGHHLTFVTYSGDVYILDFSQMGR